MGAGVFYFSKQVLDSHQVHIDYADYENDEGNPTTDTSMEWEYLIQNIQSLLPDSFSYSMHHEPNQYWKGEGQCIAWNGHVSIVLHDNDGTSACLGVIVVDEFDGFSKPANCEKLAVHYMRRFAPKLFDELSKSYSLRVRTSAWTTAAYHLTLKAA
jgi:hypothetical protein